MPSTLPSCRGREADEDGGVGMTLEEHLAVPYVLCLESVPGPDGAWLRQARYPELPGCVGEGGTPLEAIERLERARVEYIAGRWARGETIPVPRPPLRAAISVPNVDRLLRQVFDAE
jgi:predicted RNase H-like HicB family nuclease